MKLKSIITAMALATTLGAAAQDLRQFSLEDLNFGGTNYRNMVPKNIHPAWWGDVLMYQDSDEFGTLDPKTGKRGALATVAEVNETLERVDGSKVSWLFYTEFPYAGKPLALIANTKKRMLYDWKRHEVVWTQSCEGETHADWNAQSRAVAYVKSHQLYVRTADNTETQLTTDGSREIVYGQSVHRDEFGIHKGTFWSNDGQKLAFYRMDQSMVADYPQVNTFEREATYEPDKYPMAGMTSHKVTVGVYDINTGKTVYLKAGDPTDRYFTNKAWAPDGKTVYMIEIGRAHV